MLRKWLLPILAVTAAAPAAACDTSPLKIFYAPGSLRLSEQDLEVLDYMRLVAGETNFIRLTGHTDTAGPAMANMTLSQRRVDAARAYLIKLGMPPSRILTQSFGESRSITALDDGRADRRHRFVLIELLSPEEAKKGRAGRPKMTCGG
ncbi:MAG TPA: OmpA family protein [Allosphingosinicella sp.]|jgi:outer membrane protein OmpA-like peptidoglycan-associated protein